MEENFKNLKRRISYPLTGQPEMKKLCSDQPRDETGENLLYPRMFLDRNNGTYVMFAIPPHLSLKVNIFSLN